jgi:thiol-disulfide isomerase/thioredoxin
VSRGEFERGDYLDELIGRFMDFLPHFDLMPRLSADEVQRFVALGEVGQQRLKEGDRAGAEAAYHGQISIFPPNPEPYVALAFIAAGRGDNKAAMDYLQQAVVRGFNELQRVRRAEGWSRMPRTPEFLKLQDAVIAMAEIEEKWPDWGAFKVWTPPHDLGEIERQHAELVARVDAMAPALGKRLTRMWNKVLDRCTAHLLQAYVIANPEASDLNRALDRLMTLYTGGPLSHWGLLSEGVADPLAKVSRLVLDRLPESEMRSLALVGLALVRNSERDKRGALKSEAATEIRTALQEVITRYPDSPLVGTATIGLVSTEVKMGDMDRAATHYREFLESHSGNTGLIEQVQMHMGELALRLGGLPAFQATSLDGRTVEPAALRGKVVVFDFWATWCGPCVEELSSLRRIYQRHGDEVAVIGVSLDDAEDLSIDALREWIAREKIPGDQICDGLGWESKLVKAFGVREIPFNVVVGADGTVLSVNEQGKQMEKVVRAAVSGKQAGRQR